MNSFDLHNHINNINPYFPKLKISVLRSQIIKSVEENLITFISSKTGRGKSTKFQNIYMKIY